MTAQLIDISAALIRARREPGCGRCESAGRRCGPHRVADVADVLREERAAADAELLLPADVVVAVLADALNLLDDVIAETLPEHGRSAR